MKVYNFAGVFQSCGDEATVDTLSSCDLSRLSTTNSVEYLKGLVSLLWR